MASSWRVLAPALALLAIIPAAAAGKEQDPSDFETVVRGRAVEEERPADDPAGFTTVLRIKEPPAGTNLTTLVERVPGLRVRDSGPGGRQVLNLRGADSQQAVVQLDGIRLSSASAAGGVDLSLLDPAHLEKVEVRRGGGSARFGSAALGGVLSLSTPRMRTRDRSRASVSYGSFDKVAASASHSGSAWRKLRYLASASYGQWDGDFPFVGHLRGTDQVRQNNDSRQGEVLLKGDVILSDRWQVGIMDNLAASERGAPGISEDHCATARQENLRNLAALRATRHDLLLRGSKLDLILSHRMERFRFHTTCGHNFGSHAEGHDVGLTSRLTVPLGDTGQVDGGVELTEELLFDRLPEDDRVIGGDGQADRFTAGVWASSSIKLLDGALVLSPAVRLVAATEQDVVVLPKVGLLVRPLAWTGNRLLSALALVGNLGRSFRYPSYYELYVDMDSMRGNPELDPEDAVDGDVGLRWELRQIALEAAYFRRLIKNMILYAPVSPHLVEAGNYPEVDAEGVEASMRLTPGWGTDLRAAYTYTRTRWDEPVVSLPGHPRHRLVTRLAWGYPWAADKAPTWELKVWGGLLYESGMPLDRFNSISVEERVLLSVGGSFRYRWITAAARGRNLLDRRDLLDSLGFPLPPARFLISLSGAI